VGAVAGVTVVLWWEWVGVAVQASWEAGVASASIGMEEAPFWPLVEGGLEVGDWVPSKKCQRLPSHLEVPDFWPGAMVEEKGQPMEVKGFGCKWERVEIKEVKGRGCVPG